MAVKRLLLSATLLVLDACSPASGHIPRPHRDHHGFPRGGRMGQSIQSIEFNGITVLHEDLLHSMSPVQEKLDVAKQGVNVAVRFQFDEVVMNPTGKAPSQARISIVHNQTKAEVAKAPMRYQHGGRSELRGELRFDPLTRRQVKKDCANATCMVHVVINSGFLGRATAVELGKLKFSKKSNGKTGIKLLTYPQLVESSESNASWDSYGLTWSAVFHFFLVLGAGLMFLVGFEAWRVYDMPPTTEGGPVASKPWLRLALASSLSFLAMSASRAFGIVEMSHIVYLAPASVVVGIIALCYAGGPVEEEYPEGYAEDEYDGEDEIAEEELVEAKKTV